MPGPRPVQILIVVLAVSAAFALLGLVVGCGSSETPLYGPDGCRMSWDEMDRQWVEHAQEYGYDYRPRLRSRNGRVEWDGTYSVPRI